MNIKLLGRTVKITKISEVADKLTLRNRGVSLSYSKEIYFLDNMVSFNSLLHEIKHLYSSTVGVGQLEMFDHEVDCDMFAAAIEQLMLENGNDIFIKLKEFAEK